ncbi:MAG: sugar porter family MFS transporter [Bryobacteraceae bacterium]|jgi:sugar porter (SP) family MFS transporter
MKYVYRVSLVAAASGLLFGFDIAVINGALLFLRQQFGLNEVQTGFAAGSLLAGCVLGAAIGGSLSDRWGRKRILLFSALLFAVSSVGAALPRNLAEFAAARFAGGIAIGIASLLAPLYIAEVSPAAIRGRLVSLNQMAIVTGILLSYLVSWAFSFHTQNGWRWMFAAAAIPSLAFFVGLFFVPESPRWLVEMGREAEALWVLSRVDDPAGAPGQVARIREAITEESGTFAELFAPGIRRALLIGVVLAAVQQWSGVNTVLFYGSLILKERVGQQSDSAAIGVNVLIGGINFLATVVALWLIDKVGRKPLLMLSAGAMGVCLGCLGLAFRSAAPSPTLVVAAMLGCTAAFAVGLGPGVWVVLSEIFPNRIRGRAMSVATVVLWVACSALTISFLSITTAIGAPRTFWLYAAICVFTVVFVWRVTPETKGKSLEDIESFWKGRS